MIMAVLKIQELVAGRRRAVIPLDFLEEEFLLARFQIDGEDVLIFASVESAHQLVL